MACRDRSVGDGELGSALTVGDRLGEEDMRMSARSATSARESRIGMTGGGGIADADDERNDHVVGDGDIVNFSSISGVGYGTRSLTSRLSGSRRLSSVNT